MVVKDVNLQNQNFLDMSLEQNLPIIISPSPKQRQVARGHQAGPGADHVRFLLMVQNTSDGF